MSWIPCNSERSTMGPVAMVVNPWELLKVRSSISTSGISLVLQNTLQNQLSRIQISQMTLSNGLFSFFSFNESMTLLNTLDEILLQWRYMSPSIYPLNDGTSIVCLILCSCYEQINTRVHICGPLEGNPQVTSKVTLQRTSNVERIFILWRLHISFI